MDRSTFVYVTYIRTTPEKLWAALTDTEFSKKYWLGATVESGWTPGSEWRIKLADGRLADSGEILQSEPPHRLVIKWLNEWKPELKAEGYSRCVFEIEPAEGSVKLTVTHSMERADSKLIHEAVSRGWPLILSNLKTLLETGEVFVTSKAK